jgi:ankyrin repeat protein
MTAVNGTYTMGFTPVFYASTYGHAGVVKILVEARANISLANEEGRTPLHWAARNGHLECARLLVENKAPLDSKDKGNRNPLGVAKDKNMTDVAKYLESVEGKQ